MSCKWVLPKKRGFKCNKRLVARAFTQKEREGYTEKFLPGISIPALSLVLILILNEDLYACALDVKTVFLSGKLNELVFMDQPQSYDDKSGRKCKIKRCLYSLKHAS